MITARPTYHNPPCPEPRHARSRVVRNGTAASSRHQRYLCRPADGDQHTFTVSDFNEDLVAGYRHTAGEIARALAAVGRGSTYRQAAITIGGGKANGQLVAEWIRVFGPSLSQLVREAAWPRLLVVDCVRFGPIARYPAVLIGAGAGAGASQAKIWYARPVRSIDSHAWRSFFAALDDPPRVLVAEPHSLAAAAAAAHWHGQAPQVIPPQPGGRAHRLASGIVAARPPTASPAYQAATAMAHQGFNALYQRLLPRRGRFRNIEQLSRIVDLMTADLNGDADPLAYARTIRWRSGRRSEFAAPGSDI